MMNFIYKILLFLFLIFNVSLISAQQYEWIAEFDDNYNNPLTFSDFALGNTKILTVQADSNDDEFVIFANSYNDKWQNNASPLNTEFTLIHGGGGLPNSVLNTPATTGNHYTIKIENYAIANRQAVIMKTDNLPVGFHDTNPVTGIEPALQANQDYIITINLESNKSPQERAFVRYSDDEFATSGIVEVMFSTPTSSSGTATIPAVFNTDGKTVEFYVYTTTVAATALSNHDLIALSFENNGDAYYSYNVYSCCFTKEGATTWSNNDSWLAGSEPPPNADVIIAHDLIFNTNGVTVNSITVQNSVNFTDNLGFTLTIAVDGRITNNGNINFDDNTVQFAGRATVITNSPIVFNNVTLNSPASGILGVDFGDNSTINGNLRINNEASVNIGSPFYGPNSTLIYNNPNATYDRRSEWSNFGLTQDPPNGKGTPNNVSVQGNMQLNLGTENQGADAVITGNLYVAPGSTLHLNDVSSMQGSLVVGGDLTNEGQIFASNNNLDPEGSDIIVKGDLFNETNAEINLSIEPGNDLHVQGDFKNEEGPTNEEGATINFNNRAIIFEGDAVQQYNTPNHQLEIPFVVVNKNAGEVVLNNSVSIIGNGPGLQMQDNGILNLNGNNLVLGETGTSTTVNFEPNAYLRGSDNSLLTLKGNVDMGSLQFDPSIDNTTNALGTIFLQKDNANTVGFSNKVVLKDSIILAEGTLVSNANLVFESSLAKTAIVKPVTNGSISDDVVIQRFFPLSNRAFRYISSSVTTTTSIHENWQEGGETASDLSDPYNDNTFNPNPNFGTHITGSQGQVGTVDGSGLDKTQTGFHSLWEWNEALKKWDSIVNTKTQTLAVGKPYALLVRGDRSATLESNTLQGNNPATLRTTGRIVTGSFSPTIDNSVAADDFVLVGNPYQARVDMSLILTNPETNSSNFNTNYMWIWDPTIGSLGGYAVVDLSTGIPQDELGNPIPASSNADQNIEPFQACFLEATGASPTITFMETAKTEDVANNGTFSDEPPTLNGIELELYRDANPTLFDAVRLRFSPNYSTNPTYEDARKLWNSTERMAIINQTDYLSIDKRQLPGINDTIPLYLGNYQTQGYTLELDVQLEDGQHAQLYDAYLDQSEDLQNGLNTYNFNVDSSIPESTNAFRFKLVFNPQTLSTETPLTANTFTVYPNPTAGELYLQASTALVGQEASIRCFDLAGREVLSTHIDQLQAQQAFNLASISDGFYILEVQTAQQVMSFKIQLGN
jgi:hypothetical protein